MINLDELKELPGVPTVRVHVAYLIDEYKTIPGTSLKGWVQKIGSFQFPTKRWIYEAGILGETMKLLGILEEDWFFTPGEEQKRHLTLLSIDNIPDRFERNFVISSEDRRVQNPPKEQEA